MLKVVLIDSRRQRSERVQRALSDAGFAVLAVISEHDDLSRRMRELQPEAIIIDAESPTRDTLEHLSALSQEFPKPMIMLSDEGHSDLTRAAAQAGVTAYVSAGLSTTAVRSLVEVSMLHYHQHHVLHAELSRTQQSLDDTRCIDRAKCLLMERHGFSESKAYEIMRRLAMRGRLRLGDFARSLLSSENIHL